MMDIINAIIVDDEIEGINTLVFMLEEYCPNIKVIGQYESSIEGLKAIKKDKPDVLFLDINMPHINGLELLELAGAESHNAIFVTAYDEFTVQALRLNALDYLMKPVDETELTNAVTRVKPKAPILPEQIANVLRLIQNLEFGWQTPIAIKVGNQIRFEKFLDIMYCESDGNFTHVFLTENRKIYASMSLKNLEETLPRKFFLRTHREYIVNGLHVKAFDRSDGGSVTMANQKELPISRGRKAAFLDFMDGFLRDT